MRFSTDAGVDTIKDWMQVEVNDAQCSSAMMLNATSKAPVTTSKALVSTSFVLLLARHLLLLVRHLFLLASCYY